MKISVTQEDINNGVPASEHSCPIALAIRRETKATKVRVGHYSFSWQDANHYRFGNLPEQARAFVHCFDAKLPVWPFECELAEMISASEQES